MTGDRGSELRVKVWCWGLICQLLVLLLPLARRLGAQFRRMSSEIPSSRITTDKGRGPRREPIRVIPRGNWSRIIFFTFHRKTQRQVRCTYCSFRNSIEWILFIFSIFAIDSEGYKSLNFRISTTLRIEFNSDWILRYRHYILNELHSKMKALYFVPIFQKFNEFLSREKIVQFRSVPQLRPDLSRSRPVRRWTVFQPTWGHFWKLIHRSLSVLQ